MLSLTVACPSCKPVCQYSWETSSLWEEFGYGELWHRVTSGVQKGSCPLMFLGSCVLMALGGSLLGQEFEQKWCFFFFPPELTTEPKALCLLGKRSTTELNPQPPDHSFNPKEALSFFTAEHRPYQGPGGAGRMVGSPRSEERRERERGMEVKLSGELRCFIRDQERGTQS